MTTPPVQPGDILADKYRVERVLGAGGMGVVVAATHLELLEPRAIKFMLPSAIDNGEAVERFLREARAAAKLKSEHIARVYDTGRLESGAPYMVIEYLEGKDLNTLLKERGPLPLDELALYAIQACEALAEAHKRGIIHRDIKPGNLFLAQGPDPDGTPSIKVLDFGISKVNDHEMTRSNAMLGSPSYMSPEQMRSARDVDPRSDIWSLGVVLYKLATGVLPFQADNIATLVTLILEDPPRPPSELRPDLPPAFDRIVLTCLEREPSDRYPSVAALAAALAAIAPPAAHTTALRTARLLNSEPTPLPAGHTPTPQPDNPATAESHEEGTRASWGRTSFESQARPRTTRVIAAISVTAALALVIGLVIGRSSKDPGSVNFASIQESASAPAPEPATATASATASASVSATATASATASASAPVNAPVRAAPRPQPKQPSKSTDPFGRARK